jgi:hypothetical protein
MSIRSRTCLFDHDIASMSKAFETASTRLGLVDRNDPPTIAVEIIELAKNANATRAAVCLGAVYLERFTES